MPRQMRDVREFMEIAKKKSTRKIVIYTSKKHKVTKFKLRTPKQLITLVMKDPERAKKIKESFPPDTQREEIVGRRRKP